MSTELATLKGRIEVLISDSKTPNYRDTDVLLTRFAGGLGGPCLQITFLNEREEYSHVQLTPDNIRRLKKILSECFY